VPLGVGYDVANLAERAFVGAGDDDVWRALCKAFDNGDDLRAGLAAAENYLGKSEASSARMIDAREADVFEMKVLNASDGVRLIEITAFERIQQFFERI